MRVGGAEVRWFFPGPPGAETLRAFLAGDELVQERRSDLYLPFAGNDSVGFKQWPQGPGQAALELKVRTAGPRRVRFANGAQGLGVQWVKWSGAPEGEGWVRLDKARRQRKLAIEGDSMAEVDASSRPRASCIYELTELRLDGAPWWTLAREAFGESPLLDAQLLRAGDWCFARYPPCLALAVEGSRSYPE